jgi:hypothetical protein
MRLHFKGFFAAALLLSLSFFAYGQDSTDLVVRNEFTTLSKGRRETFGAPGRIGGIYHSYESDSVAFYKRTPAPTGYVPFYISHFGRHGSRWLTSESEYRRVHDLFQKASDDSVLTERGKRLLGQLDTVCEDAQGRWGQLSPLGVEEHKGIARRMYQSFPEVFRDGANIESCATMVYRTILSMAAFDESLKEINPSLNITRATGERYQAYLSNFKNMDMNDKKIEHISDSLSNAWIKPERFFNSLVSDTAWISENVKRPQSTMSTFYRLASDMEDVPYLGINLFQYLTDEELWPLYSYNNVRMFMLCGPSKIGAMAAMKDEIPLLTNIIKTADKVIYDGSLAASLRFGHDTNITPLELLMGFEDFGISTIITDYSKVSDSWKIWQISPMCANLQIIFYHKTDGDAKGSSCCRPDDVIVKILLNEREATLPIMSDIWPYYRWSDVRAYWLSRMDDVR